MCSSIYAKYYSELISNIPLCTSKLCAVDISNSFLWYDLLLCEFWVPVCYSCIEGWCGILQICWVCISIYHYLYTSIALWLYWIWFMIIIEFWLLFADHIFTLFSIFNHWKCVHVQIYFYLYGTKLIR